MFCLAGSMALAAMALVRFKCLGLDWEASGEAYPDGDSRWCKHERPTSQSCLSNGGGR